MLETIIEKRVKIFWTTQAGGSSGEFFVRGFYPALQWICLQSINETGEVSGQPSWTRLADVDQIEVLSDGYNPVALSRTIIPHQQPATTPPVPPVSVSSDATGVKATLHFDLPMADQDFYIATHAPNAFSALIEIGERLKKDEKNHKKYSSPAVALKELHQFFKELVDRSGLKIRY